MGLRKTLSNDMGKLTDLVEGPKETTSAPAAPPVAEPLENAFQGARGNELYKRILGDLEEIKDEFKPGEMQDVAASQYRQSREFVKRLEKNLPSGVKAAMGEGDIVNMELKTKSGDVIKAEYSPKIGFHFKVNDSLDIGTITDPKAQIQVTLAVRSLFKALSQSLPEGAVIRTMANMNDVRGERRVEIYNKSGFRLPDKDGQMFGKVGANGKLTPSDRNEWADQARDKLAVFFSEGKPENRFGSVKDWHHFLFRGKSK